MSLRPRDAPPTATLARRIEDAGLNASAPPQQAFVDGWLLRLSPGKAKRARCINALAQGHLPLSAMLARCRAAFTPSSHNRTRSISRASIMPISCRAS